MPAPTPIDLRGAHARAELAIPVAAGIEPQRLTLYLAAANSVALRPNRSVLRVLLDDVLVAQIPLDPRRPRIEAEIELPVQGLEAGYHRLVFDVAQHYTEDCEDPHAPELWTQIDTRRSWLALQWRWRDEPYTVAVPERLFDPKRWGVHRLTIATLGEMTPELARLGALASQVAALHLRYRPLQVLHRRVQAEELQTLMQLAEGPIVLLAPPGRPVVLPGQAAPDAATLSVHRTNTGWPLLRVQGTTTEMERALRALQLTRTPLPERTQVHVLAVDAPVGSRRTLETGPVSLRELGWTHDWAVRGMYASRKLEFRLPADFYTPRTDFLTLRLNLAYGAGLRADSVLNVLVNGRFAQAVALDQRGGARYEDYQVRIPLELLQPGDNTLEFAVSLVPAEGGRCLIQSAEGLRLTLRADSTLRLPSYAPVAAVPDLRLLARTAYPYAQTSGTRLWLGDTNSSTLGAAWTLLARLAQAKGDLLPLTQVVLSGRLPPADADIILVGAPHQLPSDLNSLPPVLNKGRILHALADTSAESGFGSVQGWVAWFNWLARGLPAVQAHPYPARVGVDPPLLGQQAALLQWVDEQGRLLTWLTVEDEALYAERMRELIGAGLWGRLRGDLFVWRDADTAHASRVGATALRGRAGMWMRLSYVFSHRPVLWVLVGLVVVALAWSTHRLLLRFKARHHAGIREED
ncbi:MAG: cellulose biosynthesis cyclic di-GMP-binding regulatory protein BcsB [Thiobacillaceae bacterium]|nr:cellulose biosynthesis cyclic di-GMP-binding regulatory protein BcsB [Thiobacillaceae bacterium]